MHGRLKAGTRITPGQDGLPIDPCNRQSKISYLTCPQKPLSHHRPHCNVFPADSSVRRRRPECAARNRIGVVGSADRFQSVVVLVNARIVRTSLSETPGTASLISRSTSATLRDRFRSPANALALQNLGLLLRFRLAHQESVCSPCALAASWSPRRAAVDAGHEAFTRSSGYVGDSTFEMP